jgi:mono/diheme cytochrome c family protein
MPLAKHKLPVTLAAAALTVGSLVLGLSPALSHAAPASQIKRGEYLVTVGGCNDCHTPLKIGAHGPQPDTLRMLSGHPQEVVLPPAPKMAGELWAWAGSATNTAFAGPWGVSYAANLTPDPETGLGRWTEAQFVATLKSGRHLGVSRPILPPMPWQNTAQMRDDDLRAIFAYLRSLAPIKNRVPDVGIAVARTASTFSAPGAAR